jgi:membrane-associated phospholipid phosphatase
LDRGSGVLPANAPAELGGERRPPRDPRSGAAARTAAQHRTYGILVIAIFAAYMGIATALYHFRGVGFITPDRWAVLLFLGAVLLGQGLAFLRDWVPFVLLVFGYEYMRGIAGNIVTAGGLTAQDHGNVQVESLIRGDKFLFGGTLPTTWLQGKLYTPGTVHWYDVLAALIYMLHFVLPLVFGFALWNRSKERFWRFTVTFILMTYAAFAFFLFLPAAPPWLAQQWGYVHGIQFPFNQTWSVLMPHHYDTFNAMTIWTRASPNPVAAMPSLHAAFPWLVMLFAVKYFGRWGLLLLAYNVALWFSVVYSGNHWVVDVLAGMVWATVCFVVMEYAWPVLVRGLGFAVPAPVRLAAARTGALISRPFGALTYPVRYAADRVRDRILPGESPQDGI